MGTETQLLVQSLAWVSEGQTNNSQTQLRISIDQRPSPLGRLDAATLYLESKKM